MLLKYSKLGGGGQKLFDQQQQQNCNIGKRRLPLEGSPLIKKDISTSLCGRLKRIW